MEAESLSLFLASPSGLDEYRRAAYECAEQVRRYLAAPAGVGFELFGWEDVLPDYGRPQGVINPLLDDCNVLVGILGNRLGTPTGEAESGFAEEFERMAARAAGGEDVQIVIYTLALGEAELDDPGEKLRQVLEFRERLRQEALLRADVDGVAEFRNKLTIDLMRLVGEAMRRPPDVAAEPPAPVVAEEGEPEAERVFDGPGDEEAEAQLRDLFAEIASAAPEAPSRFRADRLPMARMALWLSGWQTWFLESRLVGVHDLNALYRGRAEVTLSTLERRQALRTLCAEPETAAGWALIADEPQVITRRLLALAWEDSEVGVTHGAFQAIGGPELEDWLAARETSLEREALFGRLSARAAEVGARVGSAVIDLAVRLGGEDGRTLLDALGEHHEEPWELLEGRLRLEASLDSARAIELAGEAEQELGDEALRALGGAAGEAGPEDLAGLASAPTIGARIVGAEALGSKGEKAAEMLIAMVGDEDPTVATVALESLIGLGAPGVDVAALGAGLAEREGLRFDPGLRLLLGRGRSAEELLSEISWALPETAGYYEALATEHFEEFGDRLRRDLAEGFETFRAESRERELAALEPSLRRAIEALDWEGNDERTARAVEKYHSFLEGGEWNERAFTLAALRGIALHGERADAGLVRPHLLAEEAEVREAAAAALARVGGPDDVEALVAAAARRGGEPFALAALAISPAPGGAATLLIDSPRSGAAIAAARHLHSRAAEISEGTVELLLAHSEADVRRIGVAVVVARAGEESDPLEAQIERLLAGETYYYNVLALLDRLLHAPPDLRVRTRVELLRLRRRGSPASASRRPRRTLPLPPPVLLHEVGTTRVAAAGPLPRAWTSWWAHDAHPRSLLRSTAIRSMLGTGLSTGPRLPGMSSPGRTSLRARRSEPKELFGVPGRRRRRAAERGRRPRSGDRDAVGCVPVGEDRGMTTPESAELARSC